MEVERCVDWKPNGVLLRSINENACPVNAPGRNNCRKNEIPRCLSDGRHPYCRSAHDPGNRGVAAIITTGMSAAANNEKCLQILHGQIIKSLGGEFFDLFCVCTFVERRGNNPSLIDLVLMISTMPPRGRQNPTAFHSLRIHVLRQTFRLYG